MYLMLGSLAMSWQGNVSTLIAVKIKGVTGRFSNGFRDTIAVGPDCMMWIVGGCPTEFRWSRWDKMEL